MEQSILTGEAKPVRLLTYRVPHAYWEALKELDDMLKEGIIESTTSGWISPIDFVDKKDKTKRLCGLSKTKRSFRR